jgi:hypothetical protein
MPPFKRYPTLSPHTGPDPVVGWRNRRLRRAGFSRQLADTVARDCAYDLHAVLELVDRGCPAELAARILAPIEDEPPAFVTPRAADQQR